MPTVDDGWHGWPTGIGGNVLARARFYDGIRARRKIRVDRATCSLYVRSIVRVAGDLLSSDADRQRVERANRLLRRERRGPFFVWGEADHHTAPYRRHDDIGVPDSEAITEPELSSLETGVDHRYVAEDVCDRIAIFGPAGLVVA